MSNIANIIQYLKGNENRYITITNQENNTQVGKAMTYLNDIPNENLEAYLQNAIGAINKPTLVWVEMRTKNGNSSKKDHTAKIEVTPVNYVAPQVPAVPPQTQHPAVQTPVANTPSFLGAPNVFGLGIPEILTMHRKSDQLEDKKEQLAELKEEYKDLKHKYNLLEVENRESLSKLAIAESQKEMAVMLAKNENKSFADSPAFQSLIENAPQLLSGFAAMKGGAVPAQGLGSPSGASATHTEFFEYANDNLSEQQINYLGSICSFMSNPTFQTELQSLITRYATN